MFTSRGIDEEGIADFLTGDHLVISPDSDMTSSAECTHCKVLMTSWSAPGSPVRYYQCPFCSRTFSSYYSEVFRQRAGARMVEVQPSATPPPSGIPAASLEEVRWRQLQTRAARWFARLEAEERLHAGPGSSAVAACSAKVSSGHR